MQRTTKTKLKNTESYLKINASIYIENERCA